MPVNRRRGGSQMMMRGIYTAEDYLLNLDGLYAYLPLDETAGLVANNETGGDDGAYSASLTLNAATFPDERGAPLWDGNTDYIDIYPCVNTEFSAAAGSIMLWYKVSAAGVWADGVLRYIFQCRVDGNNTILLLKNSTANQLLGQYVAGGTTDSRSFATSSTDWVHLAFTWNKAADQAYLYVNGAQQAALSTLGNWTGSLSATECLIGNRAQNNAGQAAGYIARVGLVDRALTAAEVTEYYALRPN